MKSFPQKSAQDKQTVLIVDDTPDNIDILREILSEDYSVKAAISGKQALKIVNANKPDLILLDVLMPDMDGHEVCRQLKNNPVTRNIPVIFVTAKSHSTDEEQGFELGAVDYITKPISPPIVKARVKNHLALYQQQRELEKQVRLRTKELEETRLEIIHRLGRAAEHKDNETGTHVIRMSWYTLFLAQRTGADEEWVDLVFKASPMHDVGKIGIPDKVLLKPGKLDSDEWAEMKKHAQYGAKIIGESDQPLLKMAKEIALFHHEKWDGSGYPKGLSGEDIPLSARIVAIADVYDALTSVRPYKKAWSSDEALDLLNSQAGVHFDPNLVKKFTECMPQVKKIQAQYGDSLH
jgi:putative two-component system response regulator